MIAQLSLSDDVAPLLESPFIHTFHHISELVRLQSLQELIFVQGIRDKLLLTGFKQKTQSLKDPEWLGYIIHQAFIPLKVFPFIYNTHIVTIQKPVFYLQVKIVTVRNCVGYNES